MIAKNRWLWGGLFVLAAVAAFVLLRDPEPGIDYETAVVDRGDIVTSISASGKIRALNTVEVGSQLSGQLVELFADFNTPVKKGQVLARIDPSTFTARVEQSAAQAAATAAQIAQAQAALTEAQRDYDAKRRLATDGFITKRALETSEASLKQARAQLAAAKAQARASTATLNQSRIDVTRTYIRAPVDGVVIDRSVNLGQTVAASLQAPKLFVIAEDLSRMQVEASVDEADIGRVRRGQRVEFTVDAYPEDTFQGVVRDVRIAGVENQNVVTYTVVIDAPNPNRKLLPGMTANANIVLGEIRGVLKVPLAALRYQPPSVKDRGGPPGLGGGPLGGNGPVVVRFTGRFNPSVIVDRLAADLNLTDDQRKKVEAIVADSFRGMSMSGGNNLGGRRKEQEEMRAKIAAVLTPEQQAIYEEMQPGRRAGGDAAGRPGRVWVLGPDGQPRRRFVRTRTGDEDVAAVIGGELKAGERVIVGQTIPGKDEGA